MVAFELLDGLTGLLQAQLGSPWLWLLVFGIAGLDAVLPLMPSETTVVTVAVLIGADWPRLGLLVAVAGTGALAGDCLSHWIGRAAGPWMLTRLRSERDLRRYAWAQARVAEHAALLIVGARYLPGGRVASGLATGSLRFPWRRFLLLDAAGSAIWAVYSALIGYAGGAAFADEPVKGLLLAFALGLFLVAVLETARRLRSRRGSRDLPGKHSAPQRRTAHRGGRGRAGRSGADVSGLDGQQTGRAPCQGAVLGLRRRRRPDRAERRPRPSA
ncbi:DedA family protein [Amycolatopsis nigrescens]|uniref:DedA family protein n=1 Tax=Amycolatopsis nigrescens TaxID=381445 RepID=UPI00036B38AD|nr:DedA family protein [Amycolatopsis nigrescens]